MRPRAVGVCAAGCSSASWSCENGIWIGVVPFTGCQLVGLLPEAGNVSQFPGMVIPFLLVKQDGDGAEVIVNLLAGMVG